MHKRIGRFHFLLSLAVLGLMLGCGKSNDATDASKAGGNQTPSIALPVGGVIMWWGSKGELPPDFELCDGRQPTTEGAVLKTRKPDLTDKFVKGPESADGTVADLGAGGANALNLRHTHGSSQLTALIGTHDQPQLLSYVQRGRGFTGANWQLRAESAGRPAGGPNSGTAIAGDTDPALNENTDIRPAFQEIFFIIRVK